MCFTLLCLFLQDWWIIIYSHNVKFNSVTLNDEVNKEVGIPNHHRGVIGHLRPQLNYARIMGETTIRADRDFTDKFKLKEAAPEPCIPPTLADDKLILCIVCGYFVLSVIYIFYGYRCFRCCMFTTGFSMATAVVYAICLQEYLMPHYGNISVAITAGVLFGLITMLIQFVGMFMSGLHCGILGSIAGLAMYDFYVDPMQKTYWSSILFMLCCGITCAVLNIIWRRGMTIISTAVYGASIMTTCASYYFDRLATAKWVWDRVKLEPSVPPPCSLSALIIAIWPIATLIGIIVQFTITGRGIYHEQSMVTQKRRAKSQPLRLTREQRAEARQRKYRYLYQVRTAHGDVISQSYVQALQKTATSDHWNSGPGESSTLQSDSTHLTVLASDHVAHADSEEDMNQIRVCH